MGSNFFKVLRLLSVVVLAVHIFACAFWKIVSTYRTQEDIDNFLAARKTPPDVSYDTPNPAIVVPPCPLTPSGLLPAFPVHSSFLSPLILGSYVLSHPQDPVVLGMQCAMPCSATKSIPCNP